MNANAFIAEIRQLIARDELREALEQLQILLEKSPHLDEIILQLARFQDIRKQMRLGKISHADASLTQAQIRAGLLDLLREVEANSMNPEVSKEIERHLQQGRLPKHLTPPPFDPPIFEGCDIELQIVHDKLFAGQNFLMLVNGQGGIGKTSFAAKYWKQYHDEYFHLAFLYVGESIETALLSLAPALDISFPETMPPDERLELLLRRITNLDKPCLLILDNANEVKDLERHYHLLRRLGNFHILITSRLSEFEDAPCHAICALDEVIALKLFKIHYPKHQSEEDHIFRSVFNAINGNTLVLEVLAKNLHEINQNEVFYPLSFLLRDLQQRGLFQLSEQAPVKVHWQEFVKTEPRDILRAMYDLRSLPPDEISLLCNFAVLPPENISYEALKQILAPENPKVFSQLLTSLYRKGWIERNKTDQVIQYKISPVVQELVKSEKEDLLTECEQLIKFLIKALEPDEIHKDNYIYSTKFTRYAETIILSIEQINYNLGELCQNMGNFYTETGDLEKALNAYKKMEQIFTTLLVSEPDNLDFRNGLSISYSKLGDTHSSLENSAEALFFYKKDLELTKFIYESYPQIVEFKNGLATSYSKLGELYGSLGSMDKALIFYEMDFELTKALYESNPQNVEFKNILAISYAKLGVFARDQIQDNSKAKPYFQQAKLLWEDLVRDAPQYAEFHRLLGIVQRDLEEMASA